MTRPRTGLPGALASLALMGVLASSVSAGTLAPGGGEGPRATGAPETAEPAASPGAARDGLEPLVPELAAHPYRMSPGVRAFRHRLSFSPGYGSLGSDRLFTARIGYNPSGWLGYEAAIAHNPGQSVHAALHTLSAIVRHPFPGRVQPYLALGYGMVMVYPGRSLNAAPVTKNALALGGGVEFYVRNDLALRADVRHATVFGRERDREGVVAYEYLQQTIGLAFHRSIKP